VEADIIINCTSLGNYDAPECSPLNTELLDKLKEPVFCLDVIHTPEETVLLKELRRRGIPSENGVRMSEIQATMGFWSVENSYASFSKHIS
jgi:shikimate 5-dehydrogenase